MRMHLKMSMYITGSDLFEQLTCML